MRIAMITEGTYPQSFGGVSVWCDQIVRGLPEVDFQVNALSATGREPLVWALPDHARLIRVPLWETNVPGRNRRPGAQTRDCALLACHGLVRAMVATGEEARAACADALARLAELDSAPAVGQAMLDDWTVSELIDAWREGPGAAGAAGSPWYGPDADGVAMSVFDAVSVLGIVEHWLRPLVRGAPRVDVTHAVTNGLAALVGLAAKWRFGTPFLLTEHGVYLRERYLGLRAEGYSFPVRWVMANFTRQLCETAYREADLITPGNTYNHRWELRGGAPAQRIRTVHNGVDPGAFPPAGDEPPVPTVTWVGRIDPLKDLETLLRAFALVRMELPAARLRIFGGTPEGNEGYLARCRVLTAQLGIAGAVTFEGRVADIRDAYAAGHVVVLSSVSEGLPYTVIEAMASGRATVSTDVGGVAEAVGDAGWVVPPRDPPAMAAGCLRLLRDDAYRHRIAAAARQRALQCFTVDRAVDAFGSIYAELADPARPHRTPAGIGHRWLVSQRGSAQTPAQSPAGIPAQTPVQPPAGFPARTPAQPATSASEVAGSGAGAGRRMIGKEERRKP